MTTPPKGTAHVDRRELYTSLPTRIQYLQSFLEFGPDDVEALIDGQKYIKAVIPAIVNIVYKKLLRYDITARAFTTRDTRNEEPIDTWVTEESAQIRHRKMFLRWYLTKLNSDPTKMEYWEYLDKVGLMHVGKGRRNPLHIDYVFLGACMGFIQDSMFEAILSHPRLELERKIAVIKALGKVIWIQNDLLAKWHINDGVEYEDDLMEEDIANEAQEPEGYLHGKKILGNGGSNHSSGGSEDERSIASSRSGSRDGKTSLGRTMEEVEAQKLRGPSRCPFSGMAISTDSPVPLPAPEKEVHQNGSPRVLSPLHLNPPSPGTQHVASSSASSFISIAPSTAPSTTPSVAPGVPSSIPRLHVVRGKTVGGDSLKHVNPFE